MKLDCKLNLENNIRSIDIFVSSLGTSVLTQDEEEAILSNYNEKIKIYNRYVKKTINSAILNMLGYETKTYKYLEYKNA